MSTALDGLLARAQPSSSVTDPAVARAVAQLVRTTARRPIPRRSRTAPRMLAVALIAASGALLATGIAGSAVPAQEQSLAVSVPSSAIEPQDGASLTSGVTESLGYTVSGAAAEPSGSADFQAVVRPASACLTYSGQHAESSSSFSFGVGIGRLPTGIKVEPQLALRPMLPSVQFGACAEPGTRP